MAVLEPILELIPENNRIERIWKLAQMDFMKRYYNDRLGLIWALLNPMFQITVYYVVFDIMMNRGGNDEGSFVLFLTSGILVWGVFAEISKSGLRVIRSKKYLIQNIQFEKLDLFTSHALSVFMGFAFNLLIYFVLAFLLDAELNGNIVFVIPVLLNVFLISIAISIILSIVYLFVDDIRHLWDILVFMGFWGSGVIVPVDIVLEKLPSYAYINPFVGILQNLRNAVLYGVPPDYGMLAYDMFYGLALLVFAVWLFRKNEYLILEKL